ncbi:MAG: hypothetical protein Aurels2KO_37780 [Aureliella sp.]
MQCDLDGRRAARVEANGNDRNWRRRGADRKKVNCAITAGHGEFGVNYTRSRSVERLTYAAAAWVMFLARRWLI